MNKCYSELNRLETFEERFQYLKLDGSVGGMTFGFDRYINQRFYTSYEWKSARNEVVLRDLGRDLGIFGHDIYNGVLIHHMNPIVVDDILQHAEWILDPEYLITTTKRTHNAIHFGNENPYPRVVLTRTPSDTTPWGKRKVHND